MEQTSSGGSCGCKVPTVDILRIALLNDVNSGVLTQARLRITVLLIYDMTSRRPGSMEMAVMNGGKCGS